MVNFFGFTRGVELQWCDHGEVVALLGGAHDGRDRDLGQASMHLRVPYCLVAPK